ncbi:predicted protein [Nematostella vectensis]|uniref:Neuralized-like protein 4 n=2 Tax=Nematostella vectensis TaxID=45351 RepID=A7RUP8_NEMVE|nr:predicted protein [Nematostella vectensis]|eukprot:XP_001636847.1 predicted protein [Nematostella vectensis]
MAFHPSKHGRFIKLSKNFTSATREGDTYDYGVVYSDRPIHLGEVFQLQIDQVETKWAGSLRIGVTLKNPNCPQTVVVRAVTDLFVEDCKDYWILSGSRVHNGSYEKDSDLNVHSLKQKDRIGVQVTAKGDLVFFVNGICKGIAMTGLPTKKELFVIFDVYGRTKEVSWKYYGVDTLENLCKEKVIKTMNNPSRENLDHLPLPKIITDYMYPP